MTPSRRLIAMMIAVAISSVVVSLAPALADVWLIGVGILAAVVLIDGITGFFAAAPEAMRELAGSMSLETWTDIQLTFRNAASGRKLTVLVYDHHPDTFHVPELPLEIDVAQQHFVEVSYRAKPMQRGPATFACCELRIASPLGCWWRHRRVPLESTVRVYPNYSTISKLLAYEVDNGLQLAGIRQSRRRGDGIEFHQLRDYRDGDTLRTIDWKATARSGRLIAREYQDERDQQIVFILDAGRRMLAKDGNLGHFDHALNAMLLLSFVALRQGDSAGILIAGPRHSWLPPRKGSGAINALLNHVYDVQPQPIEVDYLTAATELTVNQRRRSLVIFLTNVREEDSDDLRAATDLLKRKHIVMVASLRERELDEALERNVRRFEDALRFAATSHYLDARRESLRILRAAGVFVDDCLCEELPSAVTNRYLAIKRAGIL